MAILDLQRTLAEKRDTGHDCVVYSIDLSAAFDMLRKNTLVKDINQKIKQVGLDKVIYDFLSKRKCKIEVNGLFLSEFNVDLGCVQGSVLGPNMASPS
jgi:hypothetical protein